MRFPTRSELYIFSNLRVSDIDCNLFNCYLFAPMKITVDSNIPDLYTII